MLKISPLVICFIFAFSLNSFAQCGTVTDIDGNVYNTVQIGNQCWTESNLKTTHYRDGSAIVNGNDSGTWSGNILDSTQIGEWCIYNDSLVNDSLFGKLYNWYAVTDPRGLCPAGWHIADSLEWTTMVNVLGGYDSAGEALKGLTLWQAPNVANNSSGFTALPGGGRDEFGNFRSKGQKSIFWSTTIRLDAPGNAWTWNMINIDIDANNDNDLCQFGSGFSCRCIKDSVATGVRDLKGTLDEIQIFPNPSSGNFTLKIPASEQPVTVEISDVTGRRIQQLNVPAFTQQYNLNIYQPGVYLVRVTINEVVRVRKLVIQ
jgi:uncharacterized protein (TIGR02145 family)